MSAVSFYALADLDDAQRAALLDRAEADLGAYLDTVRPIVDAVRREGDGALVRFAQEFDGADLNPTTLRVGEAEVMTALERLDPEVVAAIQYASQNIRRFHEAQLPEALWLKEVSPGSFAGERHTPIPSVACYVPRGKGSFPSVMMMTTIPAVVAGVPRIVVLTPPGRDGGVDDACLVAAHLAGVTEIYKCGGAVAVAAAAFGTETVPKVHKIVGPGSPYYGAARRLLADYIDIGSHAGPSEAIVLADGNANPRLVALDLIIESEHGPDSSAFLVTPSHELAAAVRRLVPEYWRAMGEQRVAFSSAVLGGAKGGVVLAPSMPDAVAFVNDYAPEHLMIHTDEPMEYLGQIHNAGEILLGCHTPMTLANFVIGPNNVLPTSKAAMTMSPLSVFDYLKRATVATVTRRGYDELARHAQVLARYEGFDGHALAVSEARARAERGEGPPL
ncbi:MAG: histidinol dehydrogenase [Candidatus Competibacterales bacterium]